MYILECGDGTFYTGSTKDLKKRLWEHNNSKGANYTKKKQPVRLVYFEEYARIDEAFHREKQVQGWSHAKKKSLVQGKTGALHEMSECKNESHCINVAALSSHHPVTSTPLSDRFDCLGMALGERSLSGVETTELQKLKNHNGS